MNDSIMETAVLNSLFGTVVGMGSCVEFFALLLTPVRGLGEDLRVGERVQ